MRSELANGDAAHGSGTTDPDAPLSVAGQRIEIRTMRHSDIGSAMRLKQAAQWNQTYVDWQRFLALEPAGSFVATRAGRVVGTVTTCSFQAVAWIGMMLVDPAQRRQGIATRLMQQALRRLDNFACTSVCLDATEMGAAVYQPLGFRSQQQIVRLGGSSRTLCCHRGDVRVRDFHWRDWPSLRELDEQTAGVDRTKLLKRLLVHRSGSARVVCQGGNLRGFVLDRPGSHAALIGPFVALDQAVGRALLADALVRHRHTRIMLDIPAQSHAALAAAQEAGLIAQRQFLRMVRGRPCAAPSPLVWAGSGPEKG